jgi:mevalonate kinase
MRITASAPGKLVLFGDHAAVYGKPCLVTAVDLRFYVSLETSEIAGIEISTPDLRASGETYQIAASDLNAHNRRETAFVEAALKQILKGHPLQTGLHIATEGPAITYGLGSSSAITVAVIKAAAAYFGIELDPHDLFDLAYAAVLDVQGTGSGVDLAAAVCGGTVYYVKGGAVMERLAINDLPIVIGYSGDKVSTTNLIHQVASLRARQPDLIDPILELMGRIAIRARGHMQEGNWQAVGDLMNIHQGLLDSLGVNVPQLTNLIFAARDAGAWGAKLSGAGGGDCMFALAAASDQPPVEHAIEAAGGLPVRIAANAPGVRIEPAT